MCKWVVALEAGTPHETCTYMDESCFCRHQVSKDFCIPVINELRSGSQEGKFWGRTHAKKNFSYCSLLPQTGTVMATVRNFHNSNDLLQKMCITFKNILPKAMISTIQFWMDIVLNNILQKMDDKYNLITSTI